MLLDRLVCGVRDINLQRCLLAKPNFTLQTALDARATESSNRSAAALQKTGSLPALRRTVTVHRESTERKESTDIEDDCRLWSEKKRASSEANARQPICAGCENNHPRAARRYKGVICQRCDWKDHLARVCHTRQPASYCTQQPATQMGQ